MTRLNVLVVDDEKVVRDSIIQWLGLLDFDVTDAPDAEKGLAAAERLKPDVVLTDVKMPRITGLELMRSIRRLDESVSVVLLTAHGDIPMAVEAMRDGAFDFVQKPYMPEHLAAVLQRAGEQCRLKREIEQLRFRLDGRETALEGRLVGMSPTLARLRQAVTELAGIDADVIVTGETGTGKEVVSRAIHDLSPRADGPFVAVNCAAIPAELVESELFGHEAGAFTGARGQRIGKFEQANGGTLLLDEIESMPLAVQAKVLRVLQERVVERVGSNRQIGLDIRVIAASKVDLMAESQAGRFRSDLYFRLNAAEIDLAPLRRRMEDIPLLFELFVDRACTRLDKPHRTASSSDIAALMAHRWPGNVRELKMIAERFALGLSSTGRSVEEILRLGGTASHSEMTGLADLVAAYERRLIEMALEEHGGSITAVMEALQVPRRTLNEKMVKHGIDRGDFVDRAPDR